MSLEVRTDRAHLTIGEVLNLLKEEFPDITISKIRFLESQGLLEPERTPSGYRKFYQEDVERLRYILSEQKEKFLPLKVIRRHLGSMEGLPARKLPAVALSETEAPEPEDLEGSLEHHALSGDELAAVTGLEPEVIKDLESFGMLDPRHTADGRVYGDDDLAVARLAKAFLRHGVEPRHLKMYENFARREVALFEQLISPMLRARNSEARKIAHTTLSELAGLSRDLKQVLLRMQLRSYVSD